MTKLDEIVDEYATVQEVKNRSKYLRTFEFGDDEAEDFAQRMNDEGIEVVNFVTEVTVRIPDA